MITTPATVDDEQAGAQTCEQAPPFPDTVDAFMSLIEAGWDTDVGGAARTVPAPPWWRTSIWTATPTNRSPPCIWERRSPMRNAGTCSATPPARCGSNATARPIGAGRTTRTISRRLRRALEYRDKTLCGARLRGHPRSARPSPRALGERRRRPSWTTWCLLCPFHHRTHHRGGITLTGPAHRLRVTDSDGNPMTGASLARPPTTAPPDVPPCKGPLGERAQWWWYTPFEPQPPPAPN